MWRGAGGGGVDGRDGAGQGDCRGEARVGLCVVWGVVVVVLGWEFFWGPGLGKGGKVSAWRLQIVSSHGYQYDGSYNVTEIFVSQSTHPRARAVVKIAGSHIIVSLFMPSLEAGYAGAHGLHGC